ncbi:unnamed protein product [Heligmosomoides polygyrus]|uniref:PDZ domain-containing protein n=1 Tax=Heligmosomoides polygyrus TaxID=6339 RepID=A0A183G595_HELPZ|nr:unnamed protein product [Heligmosomoides polygyrus]
MFQDDGSSVGQEMGRRKLPSIPSYSSYSTTPSYAATPPPPGASYITIPASSSSVVMPPHSMTPLAVQTDSLKRPSPSIRSQTSPAPVYINASAPIPSTSSSYSIFGVSTTCTQTALPPSERLPNGHLPEYSRPSSVASGTSSLARSFDPAIIPGASYQTTAKSKPALRPVSVSRTKPSQAPKIPHTLARVLLKKELKEALSRRRESLEACEIEANQRQYVVHKMLVTGLLPEAREDDVPRVTPCMLPMELISGARVIPKPTHSVATQKNDLDTRIPTSTQSYAQYKPQLAPIPATRQQFLPSTSLRAQLEVERIPRYKDLSSARTVETQTEQLSSTDYALSSTRPKSTTRPTQRGRSNANVQTNDLLEATKKYFEDYDRQLNELTEKAKRAQRRQFEFHDDDPLSRETRRLQLMEELARRRERMLANIDLPSDMMPYRAYHSQLALDSSDYSSVIPHYGSLPRIDYPTRSKRSPLTRDFTVHQPTTSSYGYNFGSLPRNYERCLGQQLNPIQVDHEQSFGARPAPGSTSRSMFDLIIDPRYRGSDFRADPYLSARSYPSDTTNLNMPLPYGSQQDDMISRYATYLNNEFQTGLLSQADPSPPFRYDPPPTDPYVTPLPSYTYSEPTAMAGHLSYEMPQVYSRSENNYGARPPNYPLDYGNMVDRQRLYPPVMSSSMPAGYAAKGPTARTWSGNIAPSSYDARYPREDALTRMYATVGRRRPTGMICRNGIGMKLSKERRQPSSAFFSRDATRTTTSTMVQHTHSLAHHRLKDHPSVPDLGIRVVGGKRMPGGELGAFVSAVNQAKYNQILGEVKEGDQVLEWNGVLLNGKTFEEVERIVNSSSGEVEIILKSNRAVSLGKFGLVLPLLSPIFLSYEHLIPHRLVPIPHSCHPFLLTPSRVSHHRRRLR